MSDVAPANAIDPSVVERMQINALLKQMKAGKVLTDQQEKRVHDYLIAEKEKTETPTKDKRGRVKKAIVPRGTTFRTMRDAQWAMVEEAKARLANGKTLMNHHSRALRDAWLLEESLHIWPSLNAAAADLKVSLTTLRNMQEEGCPIEPHSPIPKSPVLTWLLDRAHERGGEKGVTNVNLEAIDLQWRQAKLNKLNEHLVAEAEDRAHEGVIAAMTAVRHHLQNVLPGMLCDLVAAAHGDRNLAEENTIRLIETELRRLEPRPSNPPPKKDNQP